MPRKPKWPHIQTFRDRYGKMRYYFRRPGLPRVALPSDPSSSEFERAYHEALQGVPSVSQKTPERTIKHLIEIYYASPAFKKLAESTKRTYRADLNPFTEKFGTGLVAELTYQNVSEIIGGMEATPAQANKLRKRLHMLMKLAIKMGWRQTDPTYGIEAFKAGTFHTWTDREIATFEAFWPVGSFERTAFALHLYTGQRRSDIAAMAWPGSDSEIEVMAVGDGPYAAHGEFEVEQEKTGERLAIPMHPTLREILAAWPKRAVTILTNASGRPYTKESYGNYMREAIKEAGLPDRCKLHGLRKAAAVRLSEAGCTTHQIAAITGHRSLSEIERYTRRSNQKKLAREAMKVISFSQAGLTPSGKK